MRVEPVGAFGEVEVDPRCTCRSVHGNADTDGICDFCRPKVEAAQERRETAVHEALTAFVAAVEGLRPDRQGEVLERLFTSMATSQGDAPDTCLICGWTDGCAPSCAIEKIGELL